jgi:hypothetical protein
MSIGIQTIFKNTANQPVAASTALVAVTGLTVPVAANQTVVLDYHIPFSVGATGGFRFNLAVPAGGSKYTASLFAFDGVTAAPGVQVGVVQTAAADFANAWAVAGNHMLIVKATIVNGATAGSITLQFACNTAANAINVLAGASVRVVTL